MTGKELPVKNQWVFEDLIFLRDAEIKQVLAQLASGVISTALRTAPDKIRDKFFRSLGNQQIRKIKASLAGGPLSLAAMEKAQQLILHAAISQGIVPHVWTPKPPRARAAKKHKYDEKKIDEILDLALECSVMEAKLITEDLQRLERLKASSVILKELLKPRHEKARKRRH